MKKKYPAIPKKCPACGETSPTAFGSTCDFTILDDHMPCKWIILRGWSCRTNDGRKLVYGAVVRRGPTEDEINPVDMFEDDCVYDLSLPGRKIEEIR